ncbi:MAG: DUF4149 domain-containing protein [Campylobacterota bacterium]|nr:DUF4149 domain-containing protein [Campylobacterota bacterium]
MKQTFRNFTIGYIILLGSLLGAGLYAGVVVAPTIFHSELYLGKELLSQYQEGQLMSVNFYKLGIFVDFGILSIFLYEGYKYKMGERDTITLVATFLALATGLMFAHYYIPDIVMMQHAGEAMTKTTEFINTHKGSEINFKIFALAIFVLLIRNLQKGLKSVQKAPSL